MNMNDNTFNIIPPKEFSFNECLTFLGRSDQELLHRIYHQSVYKALKIEGQIVLFRFSEVNDRIRVERLLGTLSPHTQNVIEQYIRDLFDLDRDLAPFYKIASDDPILSELVKKYYGYRVIGIPDLFEAMIWAIIGQQINLTFAYRLKQRFVEHFGEKVVWKGIHVWLFPEPEKIAALNVTDLKKLQFTKRKAEYIIGFAQMTASGKMSKALLQDKSYEELKHILTTLRGVGNWTADYVIMRCFNHLDALPIADVGLQRALGRQLGLNRKATTTEIKEHAIAWNGWESYATFYLWRTSYD